MFAQQTATAQSVQAYASGPPPGGRQVFGPASGELSHDPVDDQLHIYTAPRVRVQDFVTEARFYNPFDASEHRWDYGFTFRGVVDNENYRLIIRSSRDVRLAFGPFIGDSIGTADGLDVSASASHLVRLLVKGGNATAFIDGRLVAGQGDVSSRIASGVIAVATGLVVGDFVAGKSIRYEGFTIWSLDP